MDLLTGVLRGEWKRLMLFMPPQHGKSQLVSVHFPAFWLAHRPDDPVILTSYGASLAHSKSWQARSIVESVPFQELFPHIRTDQTSRASEHWRIAGRRGEVIAAGVGGPITGHGALLGIVDDPFENWEQAQSPTIREKTWQWYRSTFRTRLWENGAIILIMTRWHEDDLAGRLLAEEAGRWTVVRLPALAETQEERDESNRRLGLPPGEPDPLGREPGQPLCPLRFSLEALQEIRKEVGETVWSAEYQGVPRQPTGRRLSYEMFQIVEEVPENARRVRYWDKGGQTKEGARTSGVLLAEAEGIYYVEDVVTGRWSFSERDAIMREVSRVDTETYRLLEIWIEQEPGSGGQESALSTIRNLAGFNVRADKVTGSKDARLEPFIAQAQAGYVRIKRAPWNLAWLEELCTVPLSRFRDQADATAGAFNKLALRQGGTLVRVRWPTR